MSKCDTCGKKQYGYLCDGCIHDPSATDKYEPQTNADRIRALSDEELAVWIARTQIKTIEDAMNLLRLPYAKTGEIVEIGKTEALKWLQQPAEVE